jgi:hypothetical protein
MYEGLVEDSALFQRYGTKKKGQTTFLEDGRAVIRGFEGADVSTLIHEGGHVFFRTLKYDDMNTAAKLGGLDGAREYFKLQQKYQHGYEFMSQIERDRYVNFEEYFARGFEMYIADGHAPTPKLRSVFKQFTGWMLNIYKRLKRSGGQTTGFEHYKAFRKDGDAIISTFESTGSHCETSSIVCWQVPKV